MSHHVWSVEAALDAEDQNVSTRLKGNNMRSNPTETRLDGIAQQVLDLPDPIVCDEPIQSTDFGSHALLSLDT
jgi:hypothetical protein